MLVYLQDIYGEATDFGKNKDSEEYRMKFGVFEKIIPALEDYIFKTIDPIEDYFAENRSSFGEFFKVVCVISVLATSHIELIDLAQFIENTKKDEYNKVLKKLIKWSEVEKHLETQDLLRIFVGLLNMAVQ